MSKQRQTLKPLACLPFPGLSLCHRLSYRFSEKLAFPSLSCFCQCLPFSLKAQNLSLAPAWGSPQASKDKQMSVRPQQSQGLKLSLILKGSLPSIRSPDYEVLCSFASVGSKQETL